MLQFPVLVWQMSCLTKDQHGQRRRSTLSWHFVKLEEQVKTEMVDFENDHLLLGGVGC